MNNLYPVQKKDLPQCAKVLAKAFKDYPMYKYILGEQRNMQNVEKTTRFFATYAYHYAKLYAPSPNIEGVMGIVDYEKYKITPFRFFRCHGLALAKLGSEIGKRFNDYDQLNTKVHKEIVTGSHQYIMFIGIDPEKQGQGLASRMLRPALESAAAKGQASFLETHEQRNVEIYKRYGFQLVGEHQLPNSDITMYTMLRA